MKIQSASIELIREPLKTAFGFKGRVSAHPMWNTAVKLTGESGAEAVGWSNQGILWSDPAVYNAFSPAGGNAVMFLMTDYACSLVRGMEWTDPQQVIRGILPEVWAYGRRVSGIAALRETFALNALVALDIALWKLYAAEKGIAGFDGLIPANAAPYMKTKHEALAAIPLISYTVPVSDMLREVNDGCFFLKVKLGADPGRDGDPEKMLAWDCARVSAIHEALKDLPCAYSESGRIPYYLDANGRYDSKDRLLALLDHMDRIGALERVAILEEPFPEKAEIMVDDLPVRLAADESAHSDADVRARIQMGYRAIALKPIAKTMSMTFDMVAVCGELGIPAFCADLTVPAAAVDVNKNFAARLQALPGLKVGLLESNGHQYYAGWNQMENTLPYPSGAWVRPEKGLYRLDSGFYETSGGIFGANALYDPLFG